MTKNGCRKKRSWHKWDDALEFVWSCWRNPWKIYVDSGCNRYMELYRYSPIRIRGLVRSQTQTCLSLLTGQSLLVIPNWDSWLEAAMPTLCIREMPESNFGQGTGYPHMFCCFSSASLHRCLVSTSADTINFAWKNRTSHRHVRFTLVSKPPSYLGQDRIYRFLVTNFWNWPWQFQVPGTCALRCWMPFSTYVLSTC